MEGIQGLGGEKWDDGKFLAYLDKAASFDVAPSWVACPDVIGDGKATLIEWDVWYDRLKPYGWPIALIVQEGNTIDDVMELDNQPDVLFVGGGKLEWKWKTARSWAENFDRAHIGRVGTYKRLWMADRCGAESCDSNVWRPIGQHLRKYLDRSQRGFTETGLTGFNL